MYTASFGLRCSPFEDRADAAFFFPAAQHEEAIAAMQYEAQHGDGVGLILGETGSGKTILVRALSRRLTDSEKIVVLTVPGNGAVDILREACKGFGVSLPSSLQDARGLARLRRHLSRNIREGSRPILIIDQAEQLSPGDLNDIESLLEMHDDRGRLLRIVLAAHPRFRALLDQPAFARLRQLAFTEHRLGSLSESEVAQYIRHRLSVAGAAGADIFSEDAVTAVFDQSQGVPRVINQVCSAAMLAAYGAGETCVTRRHVEGISHRAGGAPEYVAGEELEFAPANDQSRQFESAFRDDPGRNEDTAADVTQSRLSTLIQKAERMVEGLKRRMPQAADAVDQAGSKVEQLLGDARERILTLESRLSAATRRAEQAAAQVERAEHAFTHAEQIETRLTAFADQLAEQMDNVQTRVAEIMKYAAPLDDARNRLEGAVRQSDSACGRIEQTIARGSALLVEQGEKSLMGLQESISTFMETPSKKMRNSFEACQKETSILVEKSERAIKNMTIEAQKRVTQTAQTAQTQIEAATRAASDQVVQADVKIAELHDAAQSGEHTIQSAVQKAVRTTEEIKQAGEQAKEAGDRAQQAAQLANDATDRVRALSDKIALSDQKIAGMLDAAQAGERTIQNAAQKAVRTTEEIKQAGDHAKQAAQIANDAADRVRALHIESTQAAARIGADTAAARQVGESMGGLISSAEVKISQLASCQAALTHLHERLGKMLLTAHPLMERADESLGQLDERMSQSEKAKTQLGEKVTEITTHMERANQAGARAAQEGKNLQDAAQAAVQISQKLETIQEQASRDIVSLQLYLAKSSVWLTRMESFTATVNAAGQTSDELAAVVASGASLLRDVPALLEGTKRQQESLEVISDKARRESQEATERMSGHLQLFHESLQRSEGDLSAYQRRVGALEAEFQQITEKTDAAQKVATQVQTVVENAQNQSENLERVCVAVRKVFSGLSQASLNARNQAQELEQFVGEANQTARSFQHWLERVRVRLDDIMEIRKERSVGAPTDDADSGSGILEREAEMLVDNEPGAASAHLVEGGLDAALAQPYPSQAREIAQLIEKARKSKTGETDLELAGQPIR